MARHPPVPPAPKWLGAAGLLPQVAVGVVLVSGNAEWRFAALALGFAYAALILSFLGGMWWGLAAAGGGAPWSYVAAIVPSLAALASAVPWAIGTEWPGPSLVWLGLLLIGSLGVDRRLQRLGLTPPWWMRLRVPLSVGLGGLTILAAWFA